MAGNNSNDLSAGVDTSSIVEAYAQMRKSFDAVVKGEVDGVSKMNAAMDAFVAKFSNASDRMKNRFESSQKSMVESWQKRAAEASQTYAQKVHAAAERNIADLRLQGEAADKVRKSVEALIKAEEKRGGGSGHGFSSSPMLALRGVKDLFEGRTAYGEVMLGRAAVGFSELAPLATAATVAIAGFGVASLTSAKSLAEYATQVKEVQLRMGLSANEVAKFTFAAEASGQKVEVFEHAMRGLSQASDDTSKAGEQARKKMAELGISLSDSLTGRAIPTGLAIERLAVALNKLPAGMERDAAGIAILKKAYLELSPALSELADHAKIFDEYGWGPSNEEIEHLREYKKTLVEASGTFSEFARMLKEFVAPPIILTIRTVLDSFVKPHIPTELELRDAVRRGALSPTDLEMRETKGWGYGASMSRSSHAAEQRAIDRNDEAVKRAMRGGEDDELSSRLKEAQAELRELQGGLKRGMVSSAVNAPTLGKITTQRGVVAGIQAQIDDLKIQEALRKLRIDEADRLAHPYGTIPAERTLREFSQLKHLRPDEMAEARRIEAPLVDFQRGQQVENMRADVAKEVHKTTMSQVEELEKARSKASHEHLQELQLEHVSLAISTHTADELRKSEERLAETRIHTASILASDTPENRLQTEISIANVKRRAADQEATDMEARIDERTRLSAAEAEARHNRYDPEQLKALNNDLATIEMNRELSIKEMRAKHAEEIFQIESDFDKQRAQEQRHQLDTIKHDVSSLLDTLLSHPSKFLSQLGSTVRGAVLAPISSSIGEGVAQRLYPTIYGPNGTGGIAGSLRNLFGGGTYVHPGISTSSVLSDAEPMGSASPSAASPYAPNWMGGGYMNNGYVGFSGIGGPLDFGSLGAPGGTSGTFGPVRLGGGGGRFGGIGRGFDLAALKESFGIGTAHAYPGIDGTSGTTLGSILTSKGAGSLMIAGGLPLAMAGITGGRRGTWGGIAEAAGGGALTGAGIGTMIAPGLGTALGAGIGAVAGFGIGLGEKLFGVESERQHAKNLVRSQYGVSISNSMADQIVGLAKQSYGGTVSIAVRSPEVRNMLGIYAAGTGQSMALSASMSHGAGLTQSGGSLFSNPVYQYGRAYTQSSPFPNYGGPGGGGGGGSPTFVSFNFDGKAAGDAMAGMFVTPSYVQTAQASAWRGSQGRQASALMMAAPGEIIS